MAAYANCYNLLNPETPVWALQSDDASSPIYKIK